MSEIGHNGGPSMEAGRGFRKVAWTKARRSLLPALPLEVVRLRVARAKRLGLPYRTYASIRAATGTDIVGFLFSGNALGQRRFRFDLAPEAVDRLHGLGGVATRLGAIYAPARPDRARSDLDGALDGVTRAPDLTATWGGIRRDLRGFMAVHGLDPNAVVLVSATGLEREWCGAAGMAGLIAAEEFFLRAS